MSEQTVVNCAFCADPNTITDVELRLLGYQQAGQNVLEIVEKIGRDKVKELSKDLMVALDAFNIAGDAYAQTFFKRYRLATKVCDTMLANKQVDQALTEYAQHCKDHRHGTF